MISEIEAERLYRIKKRIVDDSIAWETRNNKYYLKSNVIADDGTELTLRGSKHINFGFSLLFRNAIAIRRFDFYYSHTNSDGTKLIGGIPHKHKWDGIGCFDAYEVDDVDIYDVNKGLFDFLAECNIEFSGNYQYIMFDKKE